MESFFTVVNCRKAEQTADPAVPCKKKRSAASGVHYLVTLDTVDPILLSEEEILEYSLYEGGQVRGTPSGLLRRILFRRMLQEVMPFVVYSKKTEQQTRQRIDCGQYGMEQVWSEYYEETAEAVIAYLREQQYLDDERYCQSYIRSQAGKNVSTRVLLRELYRRGIPGQMAERAVAEADPDDRANAKILLEKKLRSREETGPLSGPEKARLFRFLSGKGFSAETVWEILEEYEAGYDA